MERKAAEQILEGYAKIAEQALQQVFGDNFTEDDMFKLSAVLVAQDQQAAMEKEAEVAVFSSFADELKRMGIDPIPVLTKLNDVLED